MIDPKTKAKIIWNCRRGMLELDLILTRFVQNELERLNSHQVASFEALLNNPDPDLYAWFMGYEQPENKDFHDIIEYIRNHDRIK